MTWGATPDPRAVNQDGSAYGGAVMRITLNGCFIED